MTREPFITHSELTNEIYIVSGRKKYRVTEQAINAVDAIKALEQKSVLDKIFCIVHPLSIMSTSELEHKAIMQVAEMLEPLCLPESEDKE